MFPDLSHLAKHLEVKRLRPPPRVIDDFDVAVTVGSVVEEAHQGRAAAAGALRLLPDVLLDTKRIVLYTFLWFVTFQSTFFI